MSSIDFTHILTQAVDELSQSASYKGLFHQHRDGEPLPSAKILCKMIDLVRAILFLGYYDNSTVNSKTINYHIGVDVEMLFGLLSEQIHAELCFGNIERSSEYSESKRDKASKSAAEFINKLLQMRVVLATDIETAYNGDPATTSFDEVVFCYLAIKAITNYQIAHELLALGVLLIPRIITEMANSETGINIHPGAKIGAFFTIDHGIRVVITNIIGNNMKQYQGVTLGAKSFPLNVNGKPIKGIPRHPILEDDIIIYSNATILGRITIGEGQ